MIKVEIQDDDLRELILYGMNAGKYKKNRSRQEICEEAD